MRNIVFATLASGLLATGLVPVVKAQQPPYPEGNLGCLEALLPLIDMINGCIAANVEPNRYYARDLLAWLTCDIIGQPVCTA